MYRVVPSETARSAIDALSLSRRTELAQITHHLEHFFRALVAADYVRPVRWFSVDGYRYWDEKFPFVLLLSFPGGEHEGAELHLHMLLAAPTRR